MALRVSLQIDGDATGAVKAAQDASAAVADLGKNSGLTAETLAKANGSLEQLKNASQSAGVANDNIAGSIGGVAQKVADLASKVQGFNGSFAKAASGAAGLANEVGNVARSAGGLSLLTGGLGLAVTAASTFYDVLNRGGKTTETLFAEQTRQIDLVRGAFRGAASSAGEFYQQSKLATEVLLTASTVDLREKLQTEVSGLLSKSTAFGSIGDFLAQTRQVKAELLPFEDAILKLNEGFKSGQADVKGYVDEIARIVGINPADRLKTGAGLINDAAKAAGIENRIKDNIAGFDRLGGKRSAEIDSRLGISSSQDAFGSLERLSKATDRQSAATAAEAQAAGLGASATAKLRAEFILTEAANQAGAGSAEKYAEKIRAVADRAGEAAQKLALARLQTDTAFNRDQLGRTGIDASVADQLRGAFGNNADLNGYEAGLIRVNEQMKELKGTTQDVASGAFRDFRTEIQNGANAWEAFGKAGTNALNKIIEKLADKTFDKFISGAFGSFLGIGGTGTVANGGIVLGGPGGPGVFAAAGGGSFGPGWGVVGELGPEIIKVHAGGVTVYPHEVSKPYLPGFADGGSLSPWGNVSRLPFGQQANQETARPPELKHHVTSEVAVTVDKNGDLQAFVRDTSVKTILAYADSNVFQHHVENAVYQGRSASRI